jgi:hypothetical protein
MPAMGFCGLWMRQQKAPGDRHNRREMDYRGDQPCVPVLPGSLLQVVRENTAIAKTACLGSNTATKGSNSLVLLHYFQ